MVPIVFKTVHTADFHQIDPFGHMSTLHYLDYYLKNRFTGLREQVGLGVREASKLPIAFVNTSVTIRFFRPVLADLEFTIESQVVEHSSTDCFVKCVLRNTDQKILSECDMNISCMDKSTGRTTEWPTGFIEKFYQS